MSLAISQDTQHKLLSTLKEGDTFDLGHPFVFDPKEPIVWRCEESVPWITKDGQRQRVTLHAYFRGVMLRSVTCLLDDAGNVQWGHK